jgi:hypothetical protein
MFSYIFQPQGDSKNRSGLFIMNIPALFLYFFAHQQLCIFTFLTFLTNHG